MGITGGNLETYIRMSVICISARPNAPMTDEKEKSPPEMSADNRAGYKIDTSQEDAVRKCPLPANSDARGGRGDPDVARSKGSQIRDMRMQSPPQSPCRYYGVKAGGKLPILTHCQRYLQF